MGSKRVPELTLGNRLMLTREKAEIQSIEMARLLDVSRHSITNWEKDRNRPNRATLEKWSEFTDYSLDFILKGTIEDVVTVSTTNISVTKEQVARELLAVILGESPQRSRSGSGFGDLSCRPSLAELDLAPVVDITDAAIAALHEAEYSKAV
jgi:transcriptional regulator with XRE-family HTH domain